MNNRKMSIGIYGISCKVGCFNRCLAAVYVEVSLFIISLLKAELAPGWGAQNNAMPSGSRTRLTPIYYIQLLDGNPASPLGYK